MERFLLEVASLSHYLQGFVHPRWLFGISCINSISYICSTKALMLWEEQQLGFCQGACRSTFLFQMTSFDSEISGYTKISHGKTGS